MHGGKAYEDYGRLQIQFKLIEYCSISSTIPLFDEISVTHVCPAILIIIRSDALGSMSRIHQAIEMRLFALCIIASH